MTPIADQLFLIAHDEYTGRARVHEDTLGLALSAALLVELLFPPERIQIVGSTVLIVSHHGLPPSEPLQHRVTSLIRRERIPAPSSLSHAMWLKARRPRIYAGVGLGPHAHTANRPHNHHGVPA